MLCVSPHACPTLYEYTVDPGCFLLVDGISNGDEDGTDVRPRHEVVGVVIERHDHRTLHNSTGKLQIERVLDEVEVEPACGRLPPHLDINTEVRDNYSGTVDCLVVNSFKNIFKWDLNRS